MMNRPLQNILALATLLSGTITLTAGELIYSSKSGHLRNDSYNSLLGEFVYQQSGSVDRLLDDWSTEISSEPWGPYFSQSFSDLQDSIGQLSGQDLETAITNWADAPSNFDQSGNWINLPAPNLTPVVENVTALQTPGTKHLQIYYDLLVADSHPCTITVKWSTDNGETFPLTATAVEGSAGLGVMPGQGLQITWDMEIDWDNQFTQTGRIKVVAAREPINTETGDTSETDGSSDTSVDR